MTKRFTWTAAVLAGTSLIALNACAEPAPADSGSVMIVLDASGSMWGQIEGKPKIEIARDVLKQSLIKMPTDTSIGLITYGHRKKGDCGDIELISAPRAQNGSTIAGAVEKISPKGKTPLSAAVRMAANEMKSTEAKATVILLTDGLETCDADPCALGRELEASGVDFTAHVIGFGLTRDEGRKMACLAEETGGRYLPAGSASELDVALDQTVVEGGKDDPQSSESETLPKATIMGPDRVVTGEAFKAEWTGPDGEHDFIDIIPKAIEHTNEESSYAWTSEGSPLSIVAPGEPGDYTLRYVYEGKTERHVLASRPLSVVAGEYSLKFPDTVEIGSYIPVTWSAASALPGSYIDLVPSGYTETSGELSYAYTSDGAELNILAPVEAGKYDLRFMLEAPDGRTVKFVGPVTVRESEAFVAFPATVSAGELFSLTWEGPKGSSSYLDIVPEGYTETHGELTYAYLSNGPVLSMYAPETPGTYQVRYMLEAAMGVRRVVFSSPLTVR